MIKSISKFSAILLLVSVALGQQQSQPQPPQGAAGASDCLVQCLDKLYRKSPQVDAMKLIEVEPVKVGGSTAMCPRMNDTSQLDRSCAPIQEFFKCSAACPDDQIKKMTMGSFLGAKFVCLDRMQDVKKTLPCVSRSCPNVQVECQPKCGSIEESSKKLMTIMSKMRGGAAGAQPHAGAAGGSGGGQGGMDMSQISKALGETCSTLQCYTTCSDAPMTKECGRAAYLTQRDFILTMFAQSAQGMSKTGLLSQLPDQCKPVMASVSGLVGGGAAGNATAGNATAGAGGGGGVAPSAGAMTPNESSMALPPTGGAGAGAGGVVEPSAGTMPANETSMPLPPTEGGGAGAVEPSEGAMSHNETSVPLPETVAATEEPKTATNATTEVGKEEKTNATYAETGASKECEKPPCKGAMDILPSILLTAASIVILGLGRL